MRFPSRFFATATVLLFVGLNTKSFSATVTLTMQDSSFGTQVNDGGDFFNQNASELGMWANTGNKRTAGWAIFGQSGFGGTARNLQVGDTIQITVAATRAFGQIGFSLNAGGTQGTSYDNKTSGSRLFVNTDNYGAWYVGGLNANGLGTSSFSYTPVIDSVRDYQFKVYITSGNTADVELLVNTGTGFTSHTTLRNLTLGGGTDAENISALSIYGSDMWDGNSNDNAWWKNSTITDVGTVNLNYTGGTATFDPGVIADGQAANGSGNTANAVNIGGAAGSAVLLNQDNTFTGLTTVNADATARASHAGAFGTTALGTTVTSGGSIELSGGITIGAEALTLNGTGVGGSGGALRNTSSNNTWQGNVTISSNSRINSDSGTLTLSGTVAGSGNNMYFGGAGNIALSSTISGTATTGNGAIYKDGAGTLTLTQNNTGLTGLVRVLGGTASIASAGNIGTGTLEIGGTGRLSTTASLTRTAGLTVTDASTGASIDVASGTTFTQTGAFTGAANSATKIGKSGAGDLVFNAASGSTFGGQIQIGEGTVVAGTTGALGNNDGTANRGVDLGLNVGDQTTGTDAALLASGGVTVSQSVYVAPTNSNSKRTIGLSGSGAATFNNEIRMEAGSSLTVRAGASSTDQVTISGAITGQNGTTQNLIKSEAGTLVLSGASANTYGGNTTINNGALRLAKTAGVNAIASGTIAVNSGGTLLLGAANQIGDTTDITLSGGTLSTAGNADAVRKLTVSANSTIQGLNSTSGSAFTFSDIDLGNYSTSSGSTLTFLNSGGTTYSQGTVIQLSTVAASSWTGFGADRTVALNNFESKISFADANLKAQINFGGGTTGTTLTVAAIPEPKVYMAAGALALLIGYAEVRRRKKILSSKA